MKRLLLVLISTCLLMNAYAQKESNTWVFGDKITMTFEKDTISFQEKGLVNLSVNNLECIAPISDENGELLFYVANSSIYGNADTVVIDGLKGGGVDAAQGALVVKKPDSEDKYFIFTAVKADFNGGAGEKGIYLTEVKYNSATSEITELQKNTLISDGTHMMESITMVPHTNGTDSWLITHRAGSATGSSNTQDYIIYPVTANGVGTPVISSIGQNVPTTNGVGMSFNQIGSLKANSCYTQLAFANMGTRQVDVVDFDNATGKVTNIAAQITGFQDVYSVEFSPNGQFLYAGENQTLSLYQFDLLAANVNASKILLGKTPTPRLGQIQLATDGKIYIAGHSWSSNSALGVIHNPNNAGVASNVNFKYVTDFGGEPFVSYQVVAMGLPNFPKQYVTNSVEIVTEETTQICAGGTVTLQAMNDGQNVQAVDWTVSAPNVGTQAGGTSFTHTFNNAGKTQVTASIITSCGVTKTAMLQVAVQEIDKAEIEYTDPNGSHCEFTPISLTATGSNNYIWYDKETQGNVVSTESEYVYQGALPKTVWVEPIGKTYDAVGGPSTLNQQASAIINSFTKFTVQEPLYLKSASVSTYSVSWKPCETTVIYYEIRKGSVTGIAVLKDSLEVKCEISEVILSLNTTLDQGTYYLVYTGKTGVLDVSRNFQNYTGPYEGAEGKIKVLGDSDNNFPYAGMFFNFVTQEVLPCVQRTEFTIEKEESLNVLLGSDVTLCGSELNLSVVSNKLGEWHILAGTGTVDPSTNIVSNLSIGQNVLAYVASNNCNEASDTINITRVNPANAGEIIVQEYEKNQPVCIGEQTIEIQNPTGAGISFNWEFPEDIQGKVFGNIVKITPNAQVKSGDVSTIKLDITGCGSVKRELDIEWLGSPIVDEAKLVGLNDICENNTATQVYELKKAEYVTKYMWEATFKDAQNVEQSVLWDDTTSSVQAKKLMESLQTYPMGATEFERLVTVNIAIRNQCQVFPAPITGSLKIHKSLAKPTVTETTIETCNKQLVLDVIVPKGTLEAVIEETTNASVIVNNDQIEINDLTNGEQVTIALKASNAVCMSPTEKVKITVKTEKQCNVTSLEESLASDFVIYPNPFTSTITLSNIPSNVTTIQVIDIFGNVVENIENVTSPIELGTELSTGTYFIKVYSGEEVRIEKIQKIN